MRRWEGRTDEPLRWSLFGAGGMVGVLAVPALIVVFGLLVPLGALGGAPGSYTQVHGFLTHPVVAAALCVALGLVLWHGAHRAFHALHDLRLHPPQVVRVAFYGVAVVVPAVTYVLCLLA